MPIAEDDLDEIVAYVALDNLTAALKLADRFESNFASLARFPELGRLRRDEDVREAGYRYLIIGNYLIFYTAEKRTVLVHRILHGARDYRELL
ncbi:MAG: type II toxin-antitoxin system RelE/ParE family toxin [Acidobacteria bacterium]|nr:MAG: type II toxin-antitoxin system RelE/ParE family toxin [Acidobacteriota bacterium]